ncbi:MAG TPA: FtsH protease activity modulator HflK [Clostridia bacterium]|nr:FtsH protease activity modulator HflK [Clostridia bacterium]
MYLKGIHKRGIIIGAIILVVIILLLSSFYTVDQTDYAVLMTFGRPSAEIITPGLKYKFPYPIQDVKKLSKETFSLTLGYEDLNGEEIYDEVESKMITGDENIILADMEVQWRIVDPIAFLYNTEDPIEVLYVATSSSLRGVIGSALVDDVLTDGRTQITNDIRDNLVKLVDRYGLGISIVNVNLQDVDLPTLEVSEAFKAVTDAREERVTKINNAEKYKNEKMNEVMGERDALISDAEAVKTSRIEKAKGDVAKFNAVYSEYINSREVTKQRLVIETLQQILPKTKIYIVDDASGTVKYLPLETIEREAVQHDQQ